MDQKKTPEKHACSITIYWTNKKKVLEKECEGKGCSNEGKVYCVIGKKSTERNQENCNTQKVTYFIQTTFRVSLG